MLNYSNLNDVEFEYLCQDIMEAKLNTKLHRFARGKDGGIDLTDDVNTKKVIIQVKHYFTSSVSQLITSLKNEKTKVGNLSPKEYYVCCSKTLSPQKVNEIYQIFSNYMSSSSNVITLNEIEDFLNNPANIEVLKKHYKLWIESTGILQDVLNTNIFIDCATLLGDIENEKQLFVQTSAFNAALKCLKDKKTLFITGNPGVGKTITSKMLVLHYAANGYRVRFSTNVSNLDELKKSLSRNPETKEIILVDDCFGQAYFNMKESQNTELLSLINYINISPNKLMILNSRITILREATERKPELLKCFEGKQFFVYILNMSEIDVVEKAKIFYNHIFFNNMGKEYFAEIKKDKRYFKIIKHPNYTPRIIEFICNSNRYKAISPSEYYEFAMQQLDNPKEIWKDEYEHRLEKVDRLLLMTLYSLTDSTISEQKVKTCFEHRLSCEPNIDTTINQYEASLSRLLDGFVHLISENGTKKLSMINPSVNDYFDGRLKASSLERNQLINHVISIQQKKRLLNADEFESFAKFLLEKHEIDSYLFDSEVQKNAFISLYVCKNNILDKAYASCLYSYLNKPCPLNISGNDTRSVLEITRYILQDDIINYYKLHNYFNNFCKLDDILKIFDFGEMVEFICLIEKLFNNEQRKFFIKVVAEQLSDSIQIYCEDLDIDEFDVDLDFAIKTSSSFNGEYDDIDIQAAVSYIEEKVESDVLDEIELKISRLPEDIMQHHDFTDNISFSIRGTEELVYSYLKSDDYEDYYEERINYDDSNSEVDYIFDRD